MADMFGDSGLSGLSFQLEAYRWEDHFRRMREIRENNKSLAVAHGQLDWVVGEHNQLVGRYNKLVTAFNQLTDHARSLERGTQDRDARIAELERQLVETKAEEGRLRAKVIGLEREKAYRIWEEEARDAALRSQET